VACYGMGAEEQAREQIRLDHDGLLAQAVREGRLLRLDDLPEDFYRLSSGLGSGLPRSALLMPATEDGQINGVIELGFLR
ncbi:GAF domain-containing protein, partial [Pseudomonas sp. SIMBA_059]